MSEAQETPRNGLSENVADLTQAFEATAAREASQIAELRTALSGLIHDAQAALEDKVSALLVRAKDGSKTLRTEATRRAAQAEVLVKERPYVALGAVALGGFLLGHLLSAGRPQVVYLRDNRHV